jgi:hypothetical protein
MFTPAAGNGQSASAPSRTLGCVGSAAPVPGDVREAVLFFGATTALLSQLRGRPRPTCVRRFHTCWLRRMHFACRSATGRSGDTFGRPNDDHRHCCLADAYNADSQRCPTCSGGPAVTLCAARSGGWPRRASGGVSCRAAWLYWIRDATRKSRELRVAHRTCCRLQARPEASASDR